MKKLILILSIFLAFIGQAQSPYSDNLNEMFEEAFYNNRKINWIIAGDSNRSGSSIPNLPDYAKRLFSTLDIEVIMNAAAGMTSQQWKNNTNPATKARMSWAINQSWGLDGKNTILEFSFGVNDYASSNPLDLSQVKADLTDAITAYQSAMPAAQVVLVTPVKSGHYPRSEHLDTIYQFISDSLELPLINGYLATRGVAPAPTTNGAAATAYYQEIVHINDNGGRRLYNYIISEAVPYGMMWLFDYPEYDSIETEPALIEKAVLTDGSYNQSTGAIQNIPSYRRLEPVTVAPNSIWLLRHSGNVKTITWGREDGTFYTEFLPSQKYGEDFWEIIVPHDAVEARVTVSTSGALVDPPLSAPNFFNRVPLTAYSMPVDKINIGLNLRIK